jgi:hypothetical protein
MGQRPVRWWCASAQARICAAVIWRLDFLRRRLLGRRIICPPSHSRYGVAFGSRKGPSGAWGSISATILWLKALVWAAGGAKHKSLTPFTIVVNGKEVKQGEVTEENADLLQLFDVKEYLRPRASPRGCRFHVYGPRPATSQAAFEQLRLR